MEKRTEDSTSTVYLDQCDFSHVIFNSVEKSYVLGKDITCFYILTQQFTPRRKDWIGIFKVGWKTTRDYYTFMWVTLPKDQDSEITKRQEILFKAYYLPKDDEYYQFCYVDQEGVIRGASRPFQFRKENEDTLIVTTETVEEVKQQNKKLYKENQELRESNASLQKLNSDMESKLEKKQVMLHTLNNINKKLEQKVREQEDTWKTEVLGLKQQNEKLALENEMMGAQVAEFQAANENLGKEIRVLYNEEEELREICANLQKLNSDTNAKLKKKQELMESLEKHNEEIRNESQGLKDNYAKLKTYTDSEILRNQELIRDLEKENKDLHKQNHELNKNCAQLRSFMSEQFKTVQNELDTQKCRNADLQKKLRAKDQAWEEEVLGLKQQNEKLALEDEAKRAQVAELQGRLENLMEENKTLCKENQELKESHANLQKLNSDLESEVQKKQGLLEDQQDKEPCKEYQKLKDKHAQLLKVNSDMKSEQLMMEQKIDELKRNNSLLKDENTKLLFYVNKCGSSVPSTPLSQEQKMTPRLVFGNPYCGIQDSSAANLIPFRSISAEESSDPTEELRHQKQNLHLVCDVCQEIFPLEEKQVFDHVFCHSLGD